MFQTSYKCKVCKEYIVGVYHELASCSCNNCWVDVGTTHTRIGGDLNFLKENWIDNSLSKDAPSSEIREKLLWGSYGIDDEGNSLLDIWYEKQPKPVKEYYNNPNRNFMSPRLDEVLTKKQYKEYEEWMDQRPKKEYVLIKDMDSSHILSILETQLQITDNIKQAFKDELKSRGIDASHI